MCEPTTVGLIISAVSGAASAKQSHDVESRRDKEAARGIRLQSENEQQANARINEQIAEIEADTGAQERASALADFQGALRTSRGATEGSLEPVSGASERFAERVGAGKTALAAEGGEKAQRLSIIDGILRQRLNESAAFGRTASDINAIRGNVAGDDFLTRLRVASQRPNAGASAFLDILGGVGAGLSQQPSADPPPVRAGNPNIPFVSL